MENETRKFSAMDIFGLMVIGLVTASLFVAFTALRFRQLINAHEGKPMNWVSFGEPPTVAANEPVPTGGNSLSPIPVELPAVSDRTFAAEGKMLANQYLAAGDVEGLTAWELQVLRNTAFARYGRSFPGPMLNGYFSSRSWYRPDVTYRDGMISPVDKANINVILAEEKRAALKAVYGVINDPDGFTNLRTGPGTDYAIISEINQNERFEVINRDGEWWLAKTASGYVGYIHSSRVRMSKEMPKPVSAGGMVCGVPNSNCGISSESLKNFQPNELPFDILATKGPICESVEFYAVILKSQVVSEINCNGTYSEVERLEAQRLFPENKVFSSNRCSAYYFTNVAPSTELLAVWAGPTREAGASILRLVQATGKYPGANLRKMRVVANGT